MSGNPWVRRALLVACVVGITCSSHAAPAQEAADEDSLAVPEEGGAQIASRAAEIVRDVLSRFSDVHPEEIMAVLQQQFPRRMREFKALSEEHASEAVRYFNELVDEAKDLIEARRESPELFKRLTQHRQLEQKIRELVQACKDEQGPAREAKLTALRQALGDSFDLRQEALRADAEQMSRDLDELRLLIGKRAENRETIVERRLLELTGEAQYLEW